ncbi:carbamoyltransferase [Agrobacterium vitis]|uniref:carbamoyltransferase family protein n=1 Tax=Agrobacterium vitis TaxID=373 RepID=UPI0012E855D9|nr:carbamoyltransferase [Agrobacterium vitis]MVA36775.1 hypothetical protein [Agrobacterium vitis]
MTIILGISAFYHDSSATLIENGSVVCAFQEERFTRIKQDKSFPHRAIQACLEHSGRTWSDISEICYYEDPFKKYDRILKTYRRNFPKGAIQFIKEFPRYRSNRDVETTIRKELASVFGSIGTPFTFSEHHLSHAASAFYPSPFENAAVLCVDGVGEWATISAWQGKGNQLKPLWTIDFPHSLGLLYSAFTYFCGFKVDSGEYKLMGLAPYGSPTYADIIRKELITINADGSFLLNRRYFNYEVGNEMTSAAFDGLFGGPRRQPESALTQREMDLAASVQVVTEEIMLLLAQCIARETGATNLCLAGGVALNCVANGKVLRAGIFENIFIQPASGDCGCSMGAAYVAYFRHHPDKIRSHTKLSPPQDDTQGSYLGNHYSDEDVCAQLDGLGAKYRLLSEEELVSLTSAALADDKVVGWFQGRMEFGPRALGGRSILGNPKAPEMQRTMNLKIKNRESFRPFAPAVLADHVQDWFELDTTSPYMLIVAPVQPHHRVSSQSQWSGLDRVNEVRASIPAVVHVDYSARIQTVDGAHNPRFHSLLQAFFQRTGCPMLINTSFNVRGEPIVESPRDAFTCFMRTEMDYLVIGSAFLSKNDQKDWSETENWTKIYELD